MLLGTLGTSLLGKDTFRAGKGNIRVGQNFYCCLIHQENLKYRTITKMNLNLMVFIQEIIYL